MGAEGGVPAELDLIDRTLAQVPRGHLLGPSGLRTIEWASVLRRDGRSYPSVLASFSSQGGTARIYDLACDDEIGNVMGIHPLGALVHILVGCGLSTNPTLLTAFSQVIGRPSPTPSTVLLLEQTALSAAVRRTGDGTIALDLSPLASGIDLGVTYALFLNRPRDLLAAAPEVFALLSDLLFVPEEAARARDLHEQGLDALATASIRG
jgi:hypothetical protein